MNHRLEDEDLIYNIELAVQFGLLTPSGEEIVDEYEIRSRSAERIQVEI